MTDSSGPRGDPPSIKKVVMPKTLNSLLKIDGDGGWVEITGTITINFTYIASYYGIMIVYAKKIIIRNVHISVVSRRSYITPLFVSDSSGGGTSVVGDKLIVSFNGEARTTDWSYLGFAGTRTYRVNSFSLNSIQVIFNPKIISNRSFWANNSYYDAHIGGYGAYICLRTIATLQ